MFSSVHEARVFETERKIFSTELNKKKPSCVADYNSNIGTVDRVDMILSTLKSVRKNDFFPFIRFRHK